MRPRRLLGPLLWWAALCLCVAPSVAFWQSRDSNYNINIASSGFTPSCSQSTAFLARATGVTLTADKTNYDTLICGLVTDGVWAKLDALWILVAPDATTQGLNLVSSSFTLTPHNVSFSAHTPVTGNTTSLYFQTGFAGNLGTQFIKDSASAGACHTNTRSAGQSWATLGAVDSNIGVRLIPNFNGTLFVGQLNGNQFTPSITPTLPGMWAEDRSASTVTTVYKNGVSQTTDATASSGVGTLENYLIAENNGSNVASNFSGDTIAAAFYGASLGATLQGNIRTRINTFLSAYSLTNC